MTVQRIEDSKFEFMAHMTIQFEQNLYALKEESTIWTLYKNLQGIVTKETKSPAQYDNDAPCLINFNDQAIFKCGGNNKKIVEVYHPNSDHWSKTNDLNHIRFQSSGCSFGAKVYVFGGCNDEDALTSVETFEARQHLNGTPSILW